MTSVWDDLRTQAHSELLVLLALADWANDDGYCWPAISALASKARLSERAVQQILGRLTTTSRIRRIQGGGRGRANRYQVVTARNGAPETVNAIHRKENTEPETPNEIHPFGPKRVNLTTQNGECGAPHTSYTRQNNTTTTTNGDAVSLGEEGGSSSSLVEDLRLTLGLSKSQCDTVGGYILSHGQEYVRAKAHLVQSKPIRNRAGALLAALRDDWQPPISPARRSGLPDSQERLASAEARGRERRWTW
jgi:helix-turn-helix protein